MTLTQAPAARKEHSAVWTDSVMVVWSGAIQGASGDLFTRSGGRYDPQTDTWAPTNLPDAPSARWSHSAVWNGSRMIVWGGYPYVNTGGLYDPVADTWTAMSVADAPTPRSSHTAVVGADGSMIVWGGQDSGANPLGTGGRFDPVSNTWSSIATMGAPAARYGHTSVWTGSRMIVWGGTPLGGEVYARYDPATDTWATSPTAVRTNSPQGVWTGSLMVVGDGTSSAPLDRYDPAQDVWSAASALDAPVGGGAGSGPAVWTGQRLIVSGGRYDPIADAWSPVSTVNAPPAGSVALWTGSEMLLWGGSPGNVGGRYDPISDLWTTISTVNAPPAQLFGTSYSYAGAWTGSRMIVWGAHGEFAPHPTQPVPEIVNAGGQYDPDTDIWYPMSTTNAPTPTRRYKAVWAGDRMVVWGGSYLVCVIVPSDPWPYCDQIIPTYTSSGGSYDPAADAWTAFTGATGREAMSAISTGAEAVFWGGVRCGFSGHSIYGCGSSGGGGRQDGFRYDPQAGVVTPISTVNAPTPRSDSAAVWTGQQMIVWGGVTWQPFSAMVWDGGRYGIGGPPGPDADADGFDASCDCDDNQVSVHPGAAEICGDGLNNNCSDPFWPVLAYGERDQDDDGVTSCAGDCDDIRAGVRPGAPQICDGLNNDCDDPAWPAPPAGEADQDLDGALVCAGDCDDTQASVWPGAPQFCDGVNNDCNDPAWPSLGSTEQDVDGDTFAPCSGDCDDARAGVAPGAVQLCGDGLNNDCAHPSWPSLAGTNESDDDSDGQTECGGDCDDLTTATHHGAVEVNDGMDNQCAGEPGFGSVDELGEISFPDVANTARICWPVQPGATSYRTARADGPLFEASQYCLEPVTSPCADDVELPPLGGAFFYLVRAETPWAGSWGEDSSGQETIAACGPGEDCDNGEDDDGDGLIDCDDPDCGVCVASAFTFQDTAADNVATTALTIFFSQLSPGAGDYMLFEISGSSPYDGAWCAQRADAYVAAYLEQAPIDGEFISGNWNRWHRAEGGPWEGPVTDQFPNAYGSSCLAGALGARSWCSEYGLGGRYLTVVPGSTAACEVYDGSSCGDGTWSLTIKVGPSRMGTCGF